MKTYFIKIYHSFEKGKNHFANFLNDISKSFEKEKMILGLNYAEGQFFYSFTSDDSFYSGFESIFYTHFSDFQIKEDSWFIWNFNEQKTLIWEVTLENHGFYPFLTSNNDNTGFVYNIFRTFENFDVVNDKVSIFVELEPLVEESFSFYLTSKLKYIIFRLKLFWKFFKYVFNYKIKKNWRKEGKEFFEKKLESDLFKVKLYIVAEWENKTLALSRIKAIFNWFKVFDNYPLNKFNLKIREVSSKIKPFQISKNLNSDFLSSDEISSFFHFPKSPSNESSLLKVTAKKLSLPIWVPTFSYEKNTIWEIIPRDKPINANVIWISDYRSIKVPIWIFDEDRLRHIYTIWKTWVGKSKFLISLIADDIISWKWLALIDPHWDLIEEALSYVPDSRKDDVIIFDPTDEEFPFCLNPLDINETESKQILAKWFIDIFKKFFWANWNSKLEHVLRMIFLALLSKKDSTLFDIIRVLTDKDFRYEMIEQIDDDVVRNFWTNEFAWWNQQFNTEAIMPILNKVGQLLSIDILKNIFSSPVNKLDFRKMMDQNKILFVKLPKGKLQEEIMWFLWAMFVTKIYQAAMWRQWVSKDLRKPFFLYVDEFQNFATDTFWEILSEARKYGLWLIVAHQFISQIPKNISEALFWNIWSLVSFRISSEDALYMKKHFEPFLGSYDLANLNQREFYCKMLAKWQVQDPFSLKSVYMEELELSEERKQELYSISRDKYSRSLFEAIKIVEEQKDIVEKLEKFSAPII